MGKRYDLNSIAWDSFKVGTEVAFRSGFSSRFLSTDKKKIIKVYKTGHVIIEGHPNLRFKIGYNSEAAYANDSKRYASSIRVWNAAYDKMLADEKARIENEKRADEIRDNLSKLPLRWMTPEELYALEVVIMKVRARQSEENNKVIQLTGTIPR